MVKKRKKQNAKGQELIQDTANLESDQMLSNLVTLIKDNNMELQEICNIKLKVTWLYPVLN